MKKKYFTEYITNDRVEEFLPHIVQLTNDALRSPLRCESSGSYIFGWTNATLYWLKQLTFRVQNWYRIPRLFYYHEFQSLLDHQAVINTVRRRYSVSVNLAPSTAGVVALSVECRTCDQEVEGSTLGRARGVKTLAKFLTPMCLCHQVVQVGTKGR